jgi:hypothetical protein
MLGELWVSASTAGSVRTRRGWKNQAVSFDRIKEKRSKILTQRNKKINTKTIKNIEQEKE